jgi:hypothetical protein
MLTGRLQREVPQCSNSDTFSQLSPTGLTRLGVTFAARGEPPDEIVKLALDITFEIRGLFPRPMKFGEPCFEIANLPVERRDLTIQPRQFCARRIAIIRPPRQ